MGKKYLEKSKTAIPIKRLPFVKLFSANDHILDVGCGGGRDAKFFTQHGLKATGIDVSPVLINLAKKEAKKASFKCVDLLKMNFPKETFDGIWAEAVLLHLKRKDVPRAIKEFYEVLKPSGILHIGVRKGRGEMYEKEKLTGEYERFYTYFSQKEIKFMLKKQGFKVFSSEILPDMHKRRNISWIEIWARKKV